MHAATSVASISASNPRRAPSARRIERRPPAGGAPRAEPLEPRALLSAGDLDPTFGTGGVALVNVGAVSVASIAAAPDGKIVTAASTWGRYHDRIGIGRVNADGTTDNTLAGWTGVLPPDDVGLFSHESQSGLAVQLDRRILVAGYGSDEGAFDPVTETQYVRRVTFVARLNEDGSRDPSFGGGDGIVTGAEGIVTSASDAPFAPFGGLALQADGRILTSRAGSLYRFNADGTPDASFGGDGAAELPVPAGGSFNVLDFKAAPDGSGDFIAVGSVTSPAGEALAIARLHADGTAAAGFGGGDGLVLEPYDSAAPFTRMPVRLAFGPGGTLLLAGGRPEAGGQSRFAVARYSPAGSLDASFGRGGPDGDGVVTVGTPGETWERVAHDLAVAPDGRVVVVGNAGSPFNVVRFTPDGSVDPAFAPGGADGNGVAMVTFTPEDTGNPDDQVSYGTAFAVLLQGGGRVIAATGRSVSDGWSSSGDVVLVRLLGDGAPPAQPLTLNGTAGGDAISVDLSPDKATLRINVNGTVTSRPLAGVSGIVMNGLAGNDRLSVSNAVRLPATLDGGPGNDHLTGGGGNDTLLGGDGGDTLDGRGGADLFRGGAGTDTADYTLRRNGVFVGIGTAADDGEKGEGDNVYADVENVWGGRGNDTIRGSSANNRLVGGGGDDALYGRGGRDTILGGAGNDQAFARDGDRVPDTIDGGEGTDRADADIADLLTSVEERTPSGRFFSTDFSVPALHPSLQDPDRAYEISGGVIRQTRTGSEAFVRRYVRTARADYFDDFVFDVTYSATSITFIGVGAGDVTPPFYEPA
jgi:uncharacterized delta-60 repeat protein